jgi:hypothetical protein
MKNFKEEEWRLSKLPGPRFSPRKAIALLHPAVNRDAIALLRCAGQPQRAPMAHLIFTFSRSASQ